MTKYYDVGSLVAHVFTPHLKAHDLRECNFNLSQHGLWMSFKDPQDLIVTGLDHVAKQPLEQLMWSLNEGSNDLITHGSNKSKVNYTT